MALFRKQTTFNAHDSSFKTADNGRLVITNGVPKRCELTLKTVLRLGSKGGTLEEITSYINKKTSSTYSSGDIRYAIYRLAAEGLVSVNKGLVKVTANAIEKWRKLPKTVR